MSKQPEISSCQWLNSTVPAPEWVGYPTRLSLPTALQWSAPFAVPPIGARVVVSMNGIGPATVRAYFHSAGFLGVICEPDVLPDWFAKQNPGVTMGHFYGKEIRLPQPAVAGPVAGAEALSPTQHEPLPVGSAEAVTTAHIRVQMRVGPRKAAQVLDQMRRQYGPSPTLGHLATFSAEADFGQMLQRLQVGDSVLE